jgi:hypothetical protein
MVKYDEWYINILDRLIKFMHKLEGWANSLTWKVEKYAYKVWSEKERKADRDVNDSY